MNRAGHDGRIYIFSFLYSWLQKAFKNGISTREASPLASAIDKAVAQIKKAGRNAVVITGVQDKNIQLLALAINNHIQSEVMDVLITNNTRQGNDAEVAQLISDMNSGKVGALFIHNSNPVYTLPNAAEFVAGLEKVDLSVSFSMSDSETVNATQYALAAPHYLESWGLIEMKSGEYSVMQPTIQPLFDTRQFEESLLKWSGSEQTYFDYIKTSFAELGTSSSWNEAVQDGSFSIAVEKEVIPNEIDV